MEDVRADHDRDKGGEEPAASILVVDDEPINIKIMVQLLRKENYLITTAANGEEAWDLLQKSPGGFHTVLLDRMMPGIDGMEVLRRMKAHEELKLIPVIFQTAMNQEDEILEGIQAGAYYYLTKPYRKDKLVSVVKAAVEEHIQYLALQQEAHQAAGAVSLLTSGDFTIQHLDEVDYLSALLATMCPDPDKAVLGLWELLINAVEHGNLGISYEQKSELLQKNIWREEIDRLTHLPENRDLRVKIHFEKTAGEVVITIEDMGPGFDWKPYLDYSPNRVFDSHGRGIAIAGNYSFHSIEYLGRGNRVKAVIKLA